MRAALLGAVLTVSVAPTVALAQEAAPAPAAVTIGPPMQPMQAPGPMYAQPQPLYLQPAPVYAQPTNWQRNAGPGDRGSETPWTARSLRRPGIAMFASTYAISAITGIVMLDVPGLRGIGWSLMVPGIGPFFAAGINASSSTGSSGLGTMTALAFVDGIVQCTGIVFMLASLAAHGNPSSTRARAPEDRSAAAPVRNDTNWALMPFVQGTHAGLSLSVTGL